MKKILLNLDYLTPKNYSIISKSKLGSVTKQTKTFSSNQIKTKKLKNGTKELPKSGKHVYNSIKRKYFTL